MNWCKDTLGLGYKQDTMFTAKRVDGKQHILRRILSPLDSPGFADLTTENLVEFNKQTKDVEGVKYYSYAAATDVPRSTPLYFSYQIVKKYEGENDGLVSLTSAKVYSI